MKRAVKLATNVLGLYREMALSALRLLPGRN